MAARDVPEVVGDLDPADLAHSRRCRRGAVARGGRGGGRRRGGRALGIDASEGQDGGSSAYKRLHGAPHLSGVAGDRATQNDE
ncbi:hypothetical protein FI667_g9164, partial [Globisporangium splendens]